STGMRILVALFATALAASAQSGLLSLLHAVSLATSDDFRISALPKLAAVELESGDLRSAGPDGGRRLPIADAYPRHRDHDDIAHAAHTILGRVALAHGDLRQAREHLLASARLKGSPALRSFGPSMELAQELLAAGEHESVLEYLDLCRVFWKYDRGRIDR